MIFLSLQGWFDPTRETEFRALGTSFGNPLTSKVEIHELLAYLESILQELIDCNSREAA